MTVYQVDTGTTVEYVEADSLAREDGYLILVRAGHVVAVFARWNYVVSEADSE